MPTLGDLAKLPMFAHDASNPYWGQNLGASNTGLEQGTNALNVQFSPYAGLDKYGAIDFSGMPQGPTASTEGDTSYQKWTDPNPNIQALIDKGLIKRQAIDGEGKPMSEEELQKRLTEARSGGEGTGGLANVTYQYSLDPAVYGPGGAPKHADAPSLDALNAAHKTNSTAPSYSWGLVDPSGTNYGIGGKEGETFYDPNYGAYQVFKHDNGIGTIGKIGEAATMAALAAGFGAVGAGALGPMIGGALGGGTIAGGIGTGLGSAAGNLALNEAVTGGHAKVDPVSLALSLGGGALGGMSPELANILKYIKLAKGAYDASQGNIGAGVNTIGGLAKMGGFRFPTLGGE
jgi:hypothetical protein